MKKTAIGLSIIALISVTGCHRPDTLTKTYTIPELDTQAEADQIAKVINAKLKTEVIDLKFDLAAHTVTAVFHEQLCRTMNVEQAIAEAGFKVNLRPVYPNK